MIEAVNSSVVNTQLLRGNAEQLSASARVEVVSVEPTEKAAPLLAPFVSPYISVDRDRGAVIQIRDSDTGDVLKEFPSESVARLRLDEETTAVSTDEPRSAPQSASAAAGGFQTISIAQATPPAQAQGAGLAQAAIAALSTGAQSGQGTPTANVQVSA